MEEVIAIMTVSGGKGSQDRVHTCSQGRCNATDTAPQRIFSSADLAEREIDGTSFLERY
jgi:hypothetical protein